MAVKKDKKHKWNPSLTLVGYLLKQGKEHIRTKGHRVGRVEGKVEHIVVEEKKLFVKDDSEFIKFYIDSQSIFEFVELSLTAQRLLAYILTKLKHNEDDFYLSTDEIVDKVKLDRYSASKGIRELLDHEWIYVHEYTNRYFINLCFVCKGNREEMYNKYLAATKG